MQLSGNRTAKVSDKKFEWLKTQGTIKQNYLANNRFEIYTEKNPGRNVAESFIHDQFARHYGANVTEFLPFLMTLESSSIIRSGLGIRVAGESPLFLEQYLPGPIEGVAKKIHEFTVKRHLLVEIGNLASARKGLTQFMFIALTLYLERIGIKWVACNATRLVQNNFTRLGFRCFPICVADKHRLRNGYKHWGSYYDNSSEVTLINVHQAYRCLISNPSLMERLESLESSSNKLPDINYWANN